MTTATMFTDEHGQWFIKTPLIGRPWQFAAIEDTSTVRNEISRAEAGVDASSILHSVNDVPEVVAPQQVSAAGDDDQTGSQDPDEPEPGSLSDSDDDRLPSSSRFFDGQSSADSDGEASKFARMTRIKPPGGYGAKTKVAKKMTNANRAIKYSDTSESED